MSAPTLSPKVSLPVVVFLMATMVVGQEQPTATFHIPADPEYVVVSLTMDGSSLPLPLTTEIYADGRLVASMGGAHRETVLSHQELMSVITQLLELQFPTFDEEATRRALQEAERIRLQSREILEISEHSSATLTLHLEDYSDGETTGTMPLRKTVTWRDPLWMAKQHPDIVALQRLAAAIQLIGQLRSHPQLQDAE